jgi:hypothetical protein
MPPPPLHDIEKKFKYMESQSLKVLLARLKLLTNFENSSSDLLQSPCSGDFYNENGYRKPPVIL